jgi:transcriptional regulator with XRE-family HTH domain
MMWTVRTHESESAINPAQLAAEVEARRLVVLLRNLVKLSGRSMRSLEDELGYGSSVVSKVLSGAIRPQIAYVLAIASALGLSAEGFFAKAYPDRPRATSADLLDGLDARIEAAVRRAIHEPV